jgi:small GTP-binding protein
LKLNKTESRALEDPNESFDFFYKLIVIGDEQVGKSNLLLRMAKGYFDKKPKTTYGVEFEFKTVPLPNSNQRVRAQIWDTSGAKQFLSITTTHYRFAVGAFLIYDITNLQSFQNLPGWLEKIRAYSDDNVQIALVANKKDLVSEVPEVLFKDVIQDTEDGDEHPERATFRIESMQYEGGDDEAGPVSKFDPEKYKLAQQK